MGANNVNVSFSLSGITSGNTYHYRIKAINIYGTSYGEDMTFDAGAPSAVANLPSYIKINSAQVNGIVNANNVVAVNKFEYGLTTIYGNEVTATPNFSTGNSDVSISYLISGLTPKTNNYRLITGVHTYKFYDVRPGWAQGEPTNSIVEAFPPPPDYTNQIPKIITISIGTTTTIAATNNYTNSTSTFFDQAWITTNTAPAIDKGPQTTLPVTHGIYTIAHRVIIIDKNNSTNITTGRTLTNTVQVINERFVANDGLSLNPLVIHPKPIKIYPQPINNGVTRVQILDWDQRKAYNLRQESDNSYILLGNQAGKTNMSLRYYINGDPIDTQVTFKTSAPNLMGKNGNTNWLNNFVIFPYTTYITNDPIAIKTAILPKGTPPINATWQTEITDTNQTQFTGGVQFNSATNLLWYKATYDVYKTDYKAAWTDLVVEDF